MEETCDGSRKWRQPAHTFPEAQTSPKIPYLAGAERSLSQNCIPKRVPGLVSRRTNRCALTPSPNTSRRFLPLPVGSPQISVDLATHTRCIAATKLRMLQVNSPDPMALRPKKRNEMTTDEPTRRLPNSEPWYSICVSPYNSQRKLSPNSAKL